MTPTRSTHNLRSKQVTPTKVQLRKNSSQAVLKKKIVNLKVGKAKIDTIPASKINFNKKNPEEFKVENNPTTMFDLK